MQLPTTLYKHTLRWLVLQVRNHDHGIHNNAEWYTIPVARWLFIHGQQERKDGVVYWRCTRSHNSHCTGSVTTGSGDELLSVKNTHNHPPDAAQLEVKTLVSAIKDKTTTDLRPVPQLYQEEVQKVAALPNCSEMAAKLPTLTSLKTSLYRRRRKLLPPLPTTRADVHFAGEWAETVGGERFLLVEDGDDDKVEVFATDDNLS